MCLVTSIRASWVWTEPFPWRHCACHQHHICNPDRGPLGRETLKTLQVERERLQVHRRDDRGLVVEHALQAALLGVEDDELLELDAHAAHRVTQPQLWAPERRRQDRRAPADHARIGPVQDDAHAH
eukprot:scaffold82819_cov70-Phaeocystis_antarctica.AAC.3